MVLWVSMWRGRRSRPATDSSSSSIASIFTFSRSDIMNDDLKLQCFDQSSRRQMHPACAKPTKQTGVHACVCVCVCVRVCVCAYFRQELVFRDGCAALLSGGMFGGVSPPKKKTLFVCSVEKGGAKDRTQKKHAHTQKHTHKSTHSTQHGRTISAPTQFTQPQPTTTERKNLNTPKNDLTPTNTHGTNALHNPPLVHTEPKQDETTRHQKNWT